MRAIELWLLAEGCLCTGAVARGFINKRASNVCPSADYTAQNGLTFSTTNLCLENLPGDDISHTSPIDTIEDCMDLCSSSPGDVACTGIAYNFESNTCWLKNVNISISVATSDANTHSALATNFNYDPTDVACPYSNGSVQTTTNGMALQILCNRDMPLNDYCALDSPQPARSDGVCPYHAETMEECLEICSEAAPICKGVVFNPDKAMGYGNCYPKSDISTSNIETTAQVAPARHFAMVNNIPTLNETCSNNTITKASDGEEFLLTCNDNRPYNDLVRVHSENLTACVDACTSFKNATAGECVGVMWDSTMSSSWENCWLKSSPGTSQTAAGAFTAMKISNSSTSTSTGSGGSGTSKPSASSSSPSGGKSSSKAWIAGVVIGILAVVALIGVAVWFVRRRRASQPAVQVSELASEPKTVYAKESPPSEPVYHELGDRKVAAVASQTGPQELEVNSQHEQVYELPSETK
ncbi:uncharacterized protein PV09_08582 [Verruconis gallopava]|uniref:Apple domain-containing protein n=1 Tax=Verruconis gallopava TaxID=253628 RepID=A0A0D1YG70_9PEZI|nr:uncharacterized protein PV09_08582 [Verruconis gallopava]KIV99776.1 hypothetical protein PV09_08582 [Verruconis gallopava]